eukprot:TRINITY_DN2336_c0_g1_i1.p1 TRINITY_DN2336_c0_g1~~TRINITY_DN2336_c0_g1_i1.p1  ORF type:complete len:203 (+),score=22.52 TRINITY_DN2336_c0_g1_i1:46-654(+)
MAQGSDAAEIMAAFENGAGEEMPDTRGDSSQESSGEEYEETEESSRGYPGRKPRGWVAVIPHNYKTQMCRNWEAAQRCRYGQRCVFAHGPCELRSVQINLLAMKAEEETPSHTTPGPVTVSPLRREPEQEKERKREKREKEREGERDLYREFRKAARRQGFYTPYGYFVPVYPQQYYSALGYGYSDYGMPLQAPPVPQGELS